MSSLLHELSTMLIGTSAIERGPDGQYYDLQGRLLTAREVVSHKNRVVELVRIVNRSTRTKATAAGGQD